MRVPIKLTLVRHGQRSSVGAAGDESLTQKGKEQAQDLGTLLHHLWPTESITMLTSPKRRCIETGALLASGVAATPQVHDLLDECRSFESFDQMSARANDFIAECRAGAWSSLIVAVSHNDWLEAAVSLLLKDSLFIQWPPAAAHLFDLFDGKSVHSQAIRP